MGDGFIMNEEVKILIKKHSRKNQVQNKDNKNKPENTFWDQGAVVLKEWTINNDSDLIALKTEEIMI